MKERLTWSLFSFFIICLIAAPAAEQDSCAALTKQQYPNVTITAAIFLNDPQGFLPPKTPGMFGTPAGLKVSAPFCRVIGYIEPVRDSHIEFEVWLPPASGWNGKYLAVGNPAFEGAIKYQGLAASLEQGYATASTDTGHQDPGHKWAMGHPERLVDWTHRAVHETTVVAKRLIQAFYGKPRATRTGTAATTAEGRDWRRPSAIRGFRRHRGGRPGISSHASPAASEYLAGSR